MGKKFWFYLSQYFYCNTLRVIKQCSSIKALICSKHCARFQRLKEVYVLLSVLFRRFIIELERGIHKESGRFKAA